VMSAMLGDRQDANAAFQRVLAVSPNHAAAHDKLGVLAAIAGEFDLALQHYRAAVKSAPDNANYQFNLGTGLAGAGKNFLNDAIQAYRTAIALDARHLDARLCLAKALIRQGQAESAQGTLEDLLAIAPGHAEAARLKALLARRLPNVHTAHVPQRVTDPSRR